jgi:predicted permease
MSWRSRILNVLRGRRLDRDLSDEIDFHIEARTEELVRAGMPEMLARRRARQQFGNAVVVRELSRGVKTFPRLDSVLRDVAFGLRLWRRHKLVTAAALVSLSLAIGACAAAFALVDALILRPLPVEDPRSLIHLALRAPADTRDGLSFNYPLFRELRQAGASDVRLFAMSDQSRRDAIFDDTGLPEKVYGQWISGDALEILRVTPAVGRLLTIRDDVNPGQHPVAVLSHEFWTRRFGADPNVLGRWVTIRNMPLQIVGVAGKGFTGVNPGIMTDLWAPTMMWDDQAISDPDTRWFHIWGRMHRGAAPGQARAVLQTVFTRFQREQAARRPEESRERIAQFVNTRLYLRPAANGPSSLREDFQEALWVLAGVAALVLLIACANVAGLLVARAASRERELALRVSIGAGRGRLVQQVLIESGLLAIASSVLGLVLATIAAPAIVSMISTSRTVVRLDVHPDWRLIAFLGALGLSVAFLFGLVPAVRASAVSPNDALKAGPTRHTPRAGLFRPLVVTQVAFGFVVLFVAGLCLTSFVKLLRIDLGFDPNDLAVVRVAVADGHDLEGAPEMWRDLLARLAETPGIESASLSPWGLFEGSGRNKSVRIPDRPVDSYMPWYLEVSPGFLETMRIPLRAGRDLDWRDLQPGSALAVVVNESFARKYFPGASPLGRRFYRLDGGATLVAQEIVGVSADAKYTSLREDAPPTVYEPYRPGATAVMEVRTRLDAGALGTTLRDAFARSQPAFQLGDLTLQSTLVGNHLVRDRALALLSAFFSFAAIVLVVVGLYGVISYDLVRRTREIGIRLALGAPRPRVVGLVLADVGAMALVGLVIGAIAAAGAGRLLGSLLFAVAPSDVSSIIAPLVCLLLACVLSAAMPALRALRVDPTVALRCE